MEINESSDHTFKGDFIDEVPGPQPQKYLSRDDTGRVVFDKLEYLSNKLEPALKDLQPDYYKGTDFDVIDVCNKFEMNFNLGNVMKYIVRAGKKDPEKHIEDLNKAMEYLQREIDFINK